MGYTWNICDPFQPDVIEKGAFEKNKIVETLMDHPWIEICKKMNEPDHGEINFSPSVGFSDEDTMVDISFSCVGDENKLEFMIFYLGTENSGDKEGFDLEGSKKILELFLNRDFASIEEQIL